MCVCVQRSEDILWVSALSLHHTGPRDRTYVVRFGNKSLYPLSYLSGPIYANLIKQSFYARQTNPRLCWGDCCLNLVTYRHFTFCVLLAQMDFSGIYSIPRNENNNHNAECGQRD